MLPFGQSSNFICMAMKVCCTVAFIELLSDLLASHCPGVSSAFLSTCTILAHFEEDLQAVDSQLDVNNFLVCQGVRI